MERSFKGEFVTIVRVGGKGYDLYVGQSDGSLRPATRHEWTRHYIKRLHRAMCEGSPAITIRRG